MWMISILTSFLGFGLAIVIMGVVFFMVYSKIIKPSQQARKLLQTGLPAKAKILALNDTGVTINQNPQVQLTLEVTPDSGYPPTYQTTLRTIVSRLHIPQFQPGAKLRVRYDQNNPAQVAVEGVEAS
jgi:hypothetical protein